MGVAKEAANHAYLVSFNLVDLDSNPLTYPSECFLLTINIFTYPLDSIN